MTDGSKITFIESQGYQGRSLTLSNTIDDMTRRTGDGCLGFGIV